MNSDNVLFVVLIVGWLALRVGTRAWLRGRLAAGTISRERALHIQAATFAMLPLFALPWRHSLSDIALFVGLSVGLFVAQLVVVRLMLRFVRGR